MSLAPLSRNDELARELTAQCGPYAATLAPELLEAAVATTVGEFSEARISDFVPVLARRRLHARLHALAATGGTGGTRP